VSEIQRNHAIGMSGARAAQHDFVGARLGTQDKVAVFDLA
jgi:hypothetical protein